MEELRQLQRFAREMRAYAIQGSDDAEERGEDELAMYYTGKAGSYGTIIDQIDQLLMTKEG